MRVPSTVLYMGGIEVIMPALSSTMTEGKIVEWLKHPGDKVDVGDVLMVVESDKADMDVESFEEGYLAAILTGNGESAPVGAVVALIAESESEIDSVVNSGTCSGAVPVPVPAPAPIGSGIGVQGIAIDMPALSSTMKEGKIVEWQKNVGDKVEVGDILMVIESDKADMDVEAFEEGYISEIITPEGSATEVGEPVAIMVKSVGDVGKASLPGGAVPAASAPASVPRSGITSSDGVVTATPSAKKLAKENGLNVSNIQGTGNFGRVTADDVLKAARKNVEKFKPATARAEVVAAVKTAAPITAAGVSQEDIVAMDGMQKAVVKNMEATLAVPIFRVSREITTDSFDALYAQLKPKGVSVSAMLAKAVAMTLVKHPIVNAAYVEGGIKYNKDVNVAMAVAIDGGLITPTIIGAQDMDVFSIGRIWRELVGKAKNKKLTPAEYSSGTFTISNLGMFGVEQFDAILPPGTGSILAIAASKPKVIQDKSGHLKVIKSMTVTITCDHRHIYGADAAEFLKDLADLIENNSEELTLG
jgi:pyruvate dehydrogenase E2 component (dihydrolipoamide acetyltransferase)